MSGDEQAKKFTAGFNAALKKYNDSHQDNPLILYNSDGTPRAKQEFTDDDFKMDNIGDTSGEVNGNLNKLQKESVDKYISLNVFPNAHKFGIDSAVEVLLTEVTKVNAKLHDVDTQAKDEKTGAKYIESLEARAQRMDMFSAKISEFLNKSTEEAALIPVVKEEVAPVLPPQEEFIPQKKPEEFGGAYVVNMPPANAAVTGAKGGGPVQEVTVSAPQPNQQTETVTPTVIEVLGEEEVLEPEPVKAEEQKAAVNKKEKKVKKEDLDLSPIVQVNNEAFQNKKGTNTPQYQDESFFTVVNTDKNGNSTDNGSGLTRGNRERIKALNKKLNTIRGDLPEAIKGAMTSMAEINNQIKRNETYLYQESRYSFNEESAPVNKGNGVLVSNPEGGLNLNEEKYSLSKRRGGYLKENLNSLPQNIKDNFERELKAGRIDEMWNNAGVKAVLGEKEGYKNLSQEKKDLDDKVIKLKAETKILYKDFFAASKNLLEEFNKDLTEGGPVSQKYNLGNLKGLIKNMNLKNGKAELTVEEEKIKQSKQSPTPLTSVDGVYKGMNIEDLLHAHELLCGLPSGKGELSYNTSYNLPDKNNNKSLEV